MIHSIDLSKGEKPAYDSDTLYTRLFGKGEHNIYQPTDGELMEIDRKAENAQSSRIVMSFHFVRMYKDAARLRPTGKQGDSHPYKLDRTCLLCKQCWERTPRFLPNSNSYRVKAGNYLTSAKLKESTLRRAWRVYLRKHTVISPRSSSRRNWQ